MLGRTLEAVLLGCADSRFEWRNSSSPEYNLSARDKDPTIPIWLISTGFEVRTDIRPGWWLRQVPTATAKLPENDVPHWLRLPFPNWLRASHRLLGSLLEEMPCVR